MLRLLMLVSLLCGAPASGFAAGRERGDHARAAQDVPREAEFARTVEQIDAVGPAEDLKAQHEDRDAEPRARAEERLRQRIAQIAHIGKDQQENIDPRVLFRRAHRPHQQPAQADQQEITGKVDPRELQDLSVGQQPLPDHHRRDDLQRICNVDHQ